jgi:hypothetical protein
VLAFLKKKLFCKKIIAYSQNLVRVSIECDYTCLNHNSLVSPNPPKKKVDLKGVIIKGVYIIKTKKMNPKFPPK